MEAGVVPNDEQMRKRLSIRLELSLEWIIIRKALEPVKMGEIDGRYDEVHCNSAYEGTPGYAISLSANDRASKILELRDLGE
jgi:hypothetical protein